MSRRIDAARETAHDGDAQRGEIGAQPLSGLERHGRRGTRPDDGHRRRAKRIEIAAVPEQGRHVGNREQRSGEPGIVPRKQANAGGGGTSANGLRTLAQVRRAFTKERIAGAETLAEADAGQVGQERQRNGLIKGHEVSPPGHEAQLRCPGPEVPKTQKAGARRDTRNGTPDLVSRL